MQHTLSPYRSLSHDVTAAILVYKTKKTAAMLMYRKNPLGTERFSQVKTSFLLHEICIAAQHMHVSENDLYGESWE